MILEQFADDSIMCSQVTGHFISGAFSVLAFCKKNRELSSHPLYLLFSPCIVIFALFSNSEETHNFCKVFSFMVKDFVPYFWCSDLDQLTEIMKITGTPTQDFVQKLQSQDVSILLRQLVSHVLI